jgi:ubiquitin
MIISIETMADAFEVPVESTTTILEVKQKIQDKEGIPPDQQRLMFKLGALDDEKSLSECGICDEDKLLLRVRGLLNRLALLDRMVIYIRTLSGNTIELVVDPEETIEGVKSRIDAEGLPPDQRRLLFYGQVLEDNRPLHHYKISHLSTLHLHQARSDIRALESGAVRILVENTTGETLDFIVMPTDTFKNLKQMIEERKGILSHKQRLFLAGRHLKDESTIKDHHIQSGTTISLLVARRSDGHVLATEAVMPVPIIIKLQHMVSPGGSVWQAQGSGS